MIDWLAVNYVVSEGITMAHLTPAEKRMVMRRLADRMRTSDSFGVLTSVEVARRLGTTVRSVERMKAELPYGVQRQCPVCKQPMWVVDGLVEPHPTRMLEECPMSGRQALQGLAAVRPDLYRWLEVAV